MVKLRIVDSVGYALKKCNGRVEKSLYLHLFTYLKTNNEEL